MTPSDIDAVNDEASRLMKQGIGLMGDLNGDLDRDLNNTAQADDIAAALICFDRALELRRSLPFESNPQLRYGLAACWLNRSEALLRIGEAGEIANPLAGAVHAADEAIALLAELPLGDDPLFPRRLAIAHQNRGLALLAQGSSGAAAAAAAFADAIAVLDHDHSRLISDRQYMLAATWVNLANAHILEASAESEPRARYAAMHAVALVKNWEDQDADAADVGLKGRHVLCHALSLRLSSPTVPGETMSDDVHQASDAADDGLALVRRWEQQGVTRYRAVAYDLFRFGARVYARYQPQFLHEFVFENMDPAHSSADYVASAEMQAAAHEALSLPTSLPTSS